MLDMGKQTNDVNQGSNFESNLEDFYATLDQVEVALRCAIDCHQQAQSSNRYMQIPPNPSRLGKHTSKFHTSCLTKCSRGMISPIHMQIMEI